MKGTVIRMPDFKVRVYRYWEDGVSAGRDGFFESKVYAINGNEFLVYDDGSRSAYASEYGNNGFCWYDFTETMADINDHSCRRPVVELIEEE